MTTYALGALLLIPLALTAGYAVERNRARIARILVAIAEAIDPTPWPNELAERRRRPRGPA